jgi:hypothetical protein
MQNMKQSPITRFFVVPLTLVALVSGCHKWSPPSQSPADFIRDEEPSKVKLYLTDGRELVVENPVVTETTISGTVDDSLVTIPFEEIEQLEGRRTDVPATVVVAFLGTVLAAATVFVVACATDENCTIGPTFGGNRSPIEPGIKP